MEGWGKERQRERTHPKIANSPAVRILVNWDVGSLGSIPALEPHFHIPGEYPHEEVIGYWGRSFSVFPTGAALVCKIIS